MDKVLRLEITDKCNLRCKMCWSVDWKHNDMSFEEISSLIYDYKEHEPEGVVVLTSREPLLSKHFESTIKLCTELGLDIKLLTNATLLNDYYCDLIVNSNISFISVSIHGTEEEHDKVVSVKGAYRRTINGLKLLNDYRKMNHKDLEIRITTLVTNELAKSLDSIVDLAKNLELDLRIQHKMFHSELVKEENINVISDRYGYVDECILGFPNTANITSRNVKSILEDAKNKIKNTDIDLQVYPNLTDDEIIDWYDTIDNVDFDDKYCDHSISSIRVRANGDVTFCQYVDRTFGNLRIGNLDEIIYNNDTYIDMCKDFINGEILPICTRCCHCRNKNKVLEIKNHKI